MVQQMIDNFWQAEARSEETKKFIRDIKRLTRKFTAEEKIRIVLEGLPGHPYQGSLPSGRYSTQHLLWPAPQKLVQVKC